jgi:transcriptional regulator with XRE-family HTH domain
MAADTARRTELAAFLRTRRGRVQPEVVGLSAGTRRRTAGLRREEVAQLAGVGLTWYTWLEQGRPINASVQVLNAIARALRLDPTERAHLFRLADVPGASAAPACDDCPLPAEVQFVLDALSPYPASVVTEMFDLLAWNDAYARLFPALASSPAPERNTLYANLTSPACCHPVDNRENQVAAMVAQLRAAYGRHIGDPVWASFVQRLQAESEEFAAVWAAHNVAQPAHYLKVLRHPAFGRVTVMSTAFGVQSVPGARMVVYTPADESSNEILHRLAAGEGAHDHFPCWPAHHPERTLIPTPAPA